MKFELGNIVMTNGISVELIKSDEFKVQIIKALKRYKACDWGCVCDESKLENDDAVKNGCSIVAKYETHLGDIFIITESDRSVTTIMFTNEY